MEDWFPQLGRRRDGPWLAHRLDADTAGCLAIALRKRALIELQAAFAAGTVGKVYWAVVAGRPAGADGRIESRIGKRTGPGGWRMAEDPAGQQAVTEWRLRASGGGQSWLELRPRTGRTHQIRVHCAALGCPIVGDPIYGAVATAPVERLHLMARSLHLPLNPPVTVIAPPPAHLSGALARLDAGIAGAEAIAGAKVWGG